MAYNKAIEERKWRQWKEKEERQLRRLGMDEESIYKLRSDDWKEFNSERRFQDHHAALPENMDWEDPNPYQREITGIPELLDMIDDEILLQVLLSADKRTLQILLLKIMGFSTKEISIKIKIPENTIYTKINRLKKKINKYSKDKVVKL